MDYPKELPPLEEINAQEQSREYLEAHNYKVDIAQQVYDSHNAKVELICFMCVK